MVDDHVCCVVDEVPDGEGHQGMGGRSEGSDQVVTHLRVLKVIVGGIFFDTRFKLIISLIREKFKVIPLFGDKKIYQAVFF